MRNLPRISIITPSFNQGQYLEKTILSILEQNYPDLEYIIIDGGSTDNSVEIIKSYENHLTYWVSEKDRGQSHAINKGFEHATGDLLGWINSDDFYAPGALQAVADAHLKNPDAGAIVGAGDMIDENCSHIHYKAPSSVTIKTLQHWLDDFFWQPSCFFTREAWLKCGPLDESAHFAMDLDLWFKIASSHTFTTIPELLSSSQKHEKAKTTAQDYQAVIDAAALIIKHGGETAAKKSLVRYIENHRELLSERWRAMQKMEEMITQRDETISAQEKLLKEREIAMEKMESMINDRIAAMQQMEAMIIERDATIQAQNHLLHNTMIGKLLLLKQHVKSFLNKV